LTDYAVVVGITRYPKLLADKAIDSDLDGPNNDAWAVHQWLIDSEGGGVHPDNAKLIRTADFGDVDARNLQPTFSEIREEFVRIEEQTRQTPGNRLYLYFSGHGFAPKPLEGALFTAEATAAFPEYVYAHSWLRWFDQARRFHEIVLWMDTCMNYRRAITAAEEKTQAEIGTGAPGAVFIAQAAQTKSALEDTMADQQVHGVFTWTLLQGLRGGAANEHGRITGESLKGFLFTAMPELMPASARNSTSVDLIPHVRANENNQDVLFRKLARRPTFDVRLMFPPNTAGKELRIWTTGQPLLQVASETLSTAEWCGKLLRGLYVAEVPDAGLRHGFQVSGARAVEQEISQQGPPVIVPNAADLFRLDVMPGNPSLSISVMDYKFEEIAGDTGELHEEQSPGVYKIRLQFGSDITLLTEEIVLLDRDGLPGALTPPKLASAAPIPGSTSADEFAAAPFEHGADRLGPGPLGGLSAISLLARYCTEPGQAAVASDAHPMHGMELFDAQGKSVADLIEVARVERRQPDVDPMALWDAALAPGNYYLRQINDDGHHYEACITASPNWVTQVALQRTAAVDGPTNRRDAFTDVAVFMRQAETHRATGLDAVIEGARLALDQGRNLFAEGQAAQLTEVLVAKFSDPIAGIIGGHLLLRAMDEAEPDPVQAERFDSVVIKLRSLVGDDHPDVEALSLRCSNVALRTSRPFEAPPMFRHSWQLATQASFRLQWPELIPEELWERVRASVSIGAFFAWTIDNQTSADRTEQLSQWINGYNEDGQAPRPDDTQIALLPWELPPSTWTLRLQRAQLLSDRVRVQVQQLRQTAPIPEAAREAAYNQHVPAGALEKLWAEREMQPRREGLLRQAQMARLILPRRQARRHIAPPEWTQQQRM
jgi:hypothetical protein